ncbi:MAG: terminase small subunit, Nu1 [Alphaproteobacteria bacterium]|nr:terminase small subunit, Nu1 [Alphaproteobacteria bacterium]
MGVIARLFNLSERRVQQLAKDGVIPKPEKGKYDLVGCVRGYIAFLQDRAFGKGIVPIDAQQERARLIKAQADKTELEVKMINRTLIPKNEVENGWSSLVVAFRSRLSGLPARGSQMVLGLTDFKEVEMVLGELVQEALNELSLYDPERNSGFIAQGGEAGGTAAETDGKPMGGSIPAA